MKPNRKTAQMLALALVLSGAYGPVRAAGRQDDPFEKLKSYDFQSREAVAALQNMIQQALGNRPQMAGIEQKLVGVLQDPNATFAGKQEACRMLWMIGTAHSVPTLAHMLPDAKLSDIARYALERNADPTAGKALRAALARTNGKTLIGIINSVGDRGDVEAASALKPFTRSADPVVAEAAITAEGKVGTEGALAVLRALPASQPIVGHAMLRCAEHFAAMGKKTEAERVYLSLSGHKLPVVVQIEALRGLAALQSPRVATVALADLRSPDYSLQEAAARVGGSLADPVNTGRFIAAWPGLSIPTQIILLTAFVDRREAAATPLALRAMESQDAALRQVAIRSAGRIGSATAVPRLVELAVKGQGGDRDTARESLASMPGAQAEQALLQVARQGTPDERATLMGVLAERPSRGAMAVLLESAYSQDGHVAVEALRAMGRVGGPEDHDKFVNLIVTTRNNDVRDAAREAVVAIGQRMGDRDRASAQVLAALPTAPPSAKATLLTVLAETGGENALRELTGATTSGDAEVKQAAVTGLAETWTDARAVPALMSLAKSDPDKAIRVQAMRGWLRLIGQDDQMPAEAKVGQVANALQIAERPEEKKQALSVLRNCRVTAAMELTAKLLDDPDLFPEAADTVLYLAAPQKRDNRDEKAVTGPTTLAALDKVMQLTKDDNQRALAQKLKG